MCTVVITSNTTAYEVGLVLKDYLAVMSTCSRFGIHTP
jgi:hypothetical protein